MLSTKKEQAEFCTEFNISGEKLRNSLLTWVELEQIAKDFERKRNEHLNIVKQYAEVLQKCLGVHSLSYRVKDTKHLIEKIIRKNPKYLESGNALSLNNYEQEITDLMGIRILLLFKEDWLEVHNYLMEIWIRGSLKNFAGLFHFKERHCPHCLKKVLNKGTKEEQTYKRYTET